MDAQITANKENDQDLCCPVTGLRIIRKPEWTNVQIGPDYRVTFSLIGDRIIWSQPIGYATLDDTRRSLQLNYQVIADVIPDHSPFIQIEDFSHLKGTSYEARRYYIDTMGSNRQISGIIFYYGNSALFNVMIKLGMRIIERFNVRITNDYNEAIRLAMEMITEGKNGEPVVEKPANPPALSRNDHVKEKIPERSDHDYNIIRKENWSLEIGEHVQIYDIIDGDVLHIDVQGNLKEEYLDPIFHHLVHLFAEEGRIEGFPYLFANITNLKNVDIKARRQFIRHIRKWSEKYPVKLFIIYGPNRLLNAVANLARPLVPFKFRSSQDFGEALKLINDDKRSHLKMVTESSEDPKKERMPSGQTERFIDDVLNFLSNIKWETPGVYEYSQRTDEKNPLSPVFDSLLLVKADVDQMFMERKLSEEKFRSLSENAPDIIFTLDTHGLFTYVNPVWEKIMGFRVEDVLGKEIYDFAEADYTRNIRKIVNGMIEGETVKSLPVTLRHEDGSSRIFSMSGAPNYDEKKRLVGIVGLMKDITDQHKLEKQLRQAQRMESVGTLAGGIAHNFNNLLMGIQGHVSMMLLNTDSDHPYYGRLRSIEELVKNGSSLTQQILGYARGGKYEVKPSNIHEVLENACSIFSLVGKQIRIHKQFIPDLWIVDVDRGQIEQVFLGLFTNALDAMPEGGNLYLETKNFILDEHYVKPFKVKHGRYVKVSVTDTGIGMEKGILTRVFDPFFTTKEIGKGTGLGLATAYGIIKGHGGIINIYSEKGHGTAVTIYLPISERSADKSDKTSAIHEVRTKKGGTILLVDDEQINIDVTRELLETNDYQVITALNGFEAVEIFKRNQSAIDVVILDMMMPGMDGGETFDRLRAIDAGVKVILSSGYGITGQVREVIDRGCRGFVQKPGNIDELTRKIRQVIDQP